MRENSTIKQNILKYLANKGITAYEFYQLSGVSNGVLSQKGGISEDNIVKFLSTFPDVDANWLVKNQNDTNFSINEPEGKYAKTNKIPIIPFSAIAGKNNLNVSITEADIESFFWTPLLDNKADFAFKIQGDSMAPKYPEGSYVVCKSITLQEVTYDQVYIICIDHSPMLKRILPATDTELLCRSDNPIHRDFSIKKKNITYIAKVIASICI